MKILLLEFASKKRKTSWRKRLDHRIYPPTDLVLECDIWKAAFG